MNIQDIHGLKTYAAAAVLVLIGAYFLFAEGLATWADPSGDYGAIVKNTVGSVAIMLGTAVAALRHGMKTSADRVIKEVSAQLQQSMDRHYEHELVSKPPPIS